MKIKYHLQVTGKIPRQPKPCPSKHTTFWNKKAIDSEMMNLIKKKML